MPTLLTPNEILSLTAEAAGRLLERGDGDCALLYLALLKNGGDGEKARKDLRWDFRRTAEVSQRLAELELLRPEQAPPPPGPEERLADKPPEYTKQELNDALEREADFHHLYSAMEDVLGRGLGVADLRGLYILYDFLSLPCEVILMLSHWCARETERKYGAGHKPRMSAIKREGFHWKRMGVDTPELAEEFLKKQQAISGRERDILPLLDIRNRPAVDREREYLSAWVEKGFSDELIRLAYERTLFQKQSLNWRYMNSILMNWDKAGFRTVAEVEAGDRPPASTGKSRVLSAKPQENYEPTLERIQQSEDWLDEYMKSRDQA